MVLALVVRQITQAMESARMQCATVSQGSENLTISHRSGQCRYVSRCAAFTASAFISSTSSLLSRAMNVRSPTLGPQHDASGEMTSGASLTMTLRLLRRSVRGCVDITKSCRGHLHLKSRVACTSGNRFVFEFTTSIIVLL